MHMGKYMNKRSLRLPPSYREFINYYVCIFYPRHDNKTISIDYLSTSAYILYIFRQKDIFIS